MQLLRLSRNIVGNHLYGCDVMSLHLSFDPCILIFVPLSDHHATFCDSGA